MMAQQFDPTSVIRTEGGIGRRRRRLGTVGQERREASVNYGIVPVKRRAFFSGREDGSVPHVVVAGIGAVRSEDESRSDPPRGKTKSNVSQRDVIDQRRRSQFVDVRYHDGTLRFLLGYFGDLDDCVVSGAFVLEIAAEEEVGSFFAVAVATILPDIASFVRKVASFRG